MPQAPHNLREFSALLKVVEDLRGPDGCPWDKEQTHQTLTRFAIEEAFELAEAIDGGNDAHMCEELGDLLLQVVLHAEIARQDGRFDVNDVIAGLNSKMIRRHPHVFGDVKVGSSAEVLANWSDIKKAEKAAKGAAKKPSENGSSGLFDIPVGLPSLIRSQKIGEKTRKVDFDWSSVGDVWKKVVEEHGELAAELGGVGDRERIESELGDVLFSLAQLARHLQLDSEQALRKANTRFESRFEKMQSFVASDGKDWMKLTPEEKNEYWERAKKS